MYNSNQSKNVPLIGKRERWYTEEGLKRVKRREYNILQSSNNNISQINNKISHK